MLRKVIIIEHHSDLIAEETRVTFSRSESGGERRRTTVPKSVCDALGIEKTGDKIKWIVLDEEILVIKGGD